MGSYLDDFVAIDAAYLPDEYGCYDPDFDGNDHIGEWGEP